MTKTSDESRMPAAPTDRLAIQVAVNDEELEQLYRFRYGI
jgi:hypothetical protein